MDDSRAVAFAGDLLPGAPAVIADQRAGQFWQRGGRFESACRVVNGFYPRGVAVPLRRHRKFIGIRSQV